MNRASNSFISIINPGTIAAAAQPPTGAAVQIDAIGTYLVNWGYGVTANNKEASLRVNNVVNTNYGIAADAQDYVSTSIIVQVTTTPTYLQVVATTALTLINPRASTTAPQAYITVVKLQ